MTDLAAPRQDSATAAPVKKPAAEEAARLTRKRYQAEARFRWYGVTAIAVAIVFIALLFASILRTGLPAFWHHYYVAELDLAADAIDPSGKRDPKELASADYFAIARDSLRAAFPEVTDRRERNRLAQLLSSGAADPIRQAVAADPSLIGKKAKLSTPLSANADIHFKGDSTRITEAAGAGIATPSATTGEINILLGANAFATQLVGIKRSLAERARELRFEADRIESSAGGTVVPRVQELREQAKGMQARFDAASGAETLDDRMASLFVHINGGIVKLNKIDNARVEGRVIRPLTSTADAQPGAWKIVTFETPESRRKASDLDIVWLEQLKAQGRVENRFNWSFFTAGDSREPELAGIRGAIMGSLLMLIVTLALCLPIGVMAAIYLEEFAPKNWVTDLIEVNINNLAAVPSIVFGLLGLAVFLNFFNMPRSAPLVGGLVLALLVLPTIIIAARAAIKAVPPSIREGALGVGASHQQAVFHHVLPLAMPGIMTGTIIGMAHALGETAPLLMIGMIAFIVDVPKTFTDAATVLPVQIYLWSDLPEQAFKAKTAAAIIVLLVFLFVMNGLAIYLRKRFERRW